MKKWLLIGSLSCALVSFGLAPSQAPLVASTPVISQRSSDAKQPISPKVELLSPGAEPRQPLRFKPAVNTKQAAILKFDVDMELSISGQPMPKVELPTNVLTVDTLVTKVDSNGDIHYQFRYTKIDIVDNGKVPKPVLDAMKKQNQQLIGISGTFVVDDRGQPKSGSFSIPANVDPTTRQTLEQLSQSISQFSSPMPEAAIGQGAQWQVTTPVTLNGISLTQTANYQLTSLKDGVATMEIRLKQQAQPQDLKQPGLPAGVKMALKSLSSQGKGDLTVRMDQLLPLRSTISVQSDNVISTTNLNATGETLINTKSLMEMMIESKP
jgi:hypothetical protein